MWGIGGVRRCIRWRMQCLLIGLSDVGVLGLAVILLLLERKGPIERTVSSGIHK
ncbi:MAG: hypothetical protein RL491_1126 [Bacteroidota bacterium]|jgi:hypothetical protein